MQSNLDRIFQSKLVAIIRGVDDNKILPAVKALHQGGISIIEVTANTEGYLSHIRSIKEEFGDSVLVGAGTVLDPETAKAAIDAGASFILSPTVNPETIKLTKRYGKISIPGAFTPTEILNAYEAGADIVKVFPANVAGPRFTKDVHGPLPHIPLMPTGGIDLSNITEYLEYGAAAVGIGSTLVNSEKLITEADFDKLTEVAKAFVEKIS